MSICIRPLTLQMAKIKLRAICNSNQNKTTYSKTHQIQSEAQVTPSTLKTKTNRKDNQFCRPTRIKTTKMGSKRPRLTMRVRVTRAIIQRKVYFTTGTLNGRNRPWKKKLHLMKGSKKLTRMTNQKSFTTIEKSEQRGIEK